MLKKPLSWHPTPHIRERKSLPGWEKTRASAAFAGCGSVQVGGRVPGFADLPETAGQWAADQADFGHSFLLSSRADRRLGSVLVFAWAGAHGCFRYKTLRTACAKFENGRFIFYPSKFIIIFDRLRQNRGIIK
jgi:hypothetical protein